MKSCTVPTSIGGPEETSLLDGWMTTPKTTPNSPSGNDNMPLSQFKEADEGPGTNAHFEVEERVRDEQNNQSVALYADHIYEDLLLQEAPIVHRWGPNSCETSKPPSRKSANAAGTRTSRKNPYERFEAVEEEKKEEPRTYSFTPSYEENPLPRSGDFFFNIVGLFQPSGKKSRSKV
jgi:hypothetical protein